MILSYETENSPSILDNIITLGDIGVKLTKADLEKAGFVVKKIESLDDFTDLLSGDDPLVYAKVTVPLSLTAQNRITIPAGKTAVVEVNETISCKKSGFVVEDGGTLILSGTGTIETTNKSTSGAMIEASGKDAKVIVEGVTLDATIAGKANNYGYGIYLLEDASLDFKSGTIKTAYGSCISTNNTTGGATQVNIYGGELYSDGSYAIYCPSQVTFNITGGKVQGINARMGIFNISDNAEIIGTTITDADKDDIGDNFNTSGCVWLGDTIAVMAGTYTDEDGTDCVITIAGDATVRSSFRSAIGIYEVDTKAAQNIVVNIATPTNVSTTAEGFSDVEIYDHEYIHAAAEAKGKNYNPTVQSDVVVNTP